jgi:hypothetical protein
MFPLTGFLYVTRGLETTPFTFKPYDFDQLARFDPGQQTVTVNALQKRFVFKNGSQQVEIQESGRVYAKALSSPIRMAGGDPRATLVGLRDLAEIFGFNLAWEPKTSTALLSSPAFLKAAQQGFSDQVLAEDATDMRPTAFRLEPLAGLQTAFLEAKPLTARSSLAGSSVAIYYEAWGAGNNPQLALSGYEKLFRTPPGNAPLPDPCAPKPAVLACRYENLPVTKELKYVLARPLKKQ